MPRVPHLPPSLLCVLLLTAAACAREGGGGDVRRDSAAVDSTAERTAAGAVPRLGALPDTLDVDTLPDEVEGWRVTRAFSFGGVRLRMPSAAREVRRDSASVEWGGFAPCAGECRLTLSIERGRADIDSLALAWRELTARMRPGGGEVERVTLGGHPALRGPTLCADCDGVDYIVPGDGVLARFTISMAREGGPEAAAARERFPRVLDTFAWDTAAAAPTSPASPSPSAPPPAQ